MLYVLLLLAALAFIGVVAVWFRRFPSYVWALAGVVASVLPLLMGLAAGGLGERLGCTVNEGGASGCLLAGADVSGMLGSMAVLPWGMFFTFPATVACGLLALVLFVQAQRRGVSEASGGPQ